MFENWKNRSVFVTGATGFLGANLTRMLVGHGARVVGLERDVVQPNSLDALELRTSVTVVRGDVQDIAMLERVLNEYEIDSVFHLAAQALVGAANRSPLATFETNIRGTYMLLEACRNSPLVKRVAVASSDKAYGSHDTLPYTEEFPLLATFPYDVSKACTDIIAMSYARTYGLPVTVSRSANIYGRADLNLSRVIPGTILSVLSGEDPVIRSDGSPIREFISVDDVAEAYLLIADNIDKTAGRSFNFGTNAPIRVLDLVEKIIDLCEMTGRVKPDILLSTKIEREIDAQYLSGGRIAEVLGWRPRITLDEGLADAINWYRDHSAMVKSQNA
jgi:CDP-glucose 4,6-dehydratase